MVLDMVCVLVYSHSNTMRREVTTTIAPLLFTRQLRGDALTLAYILLKIFYRPVHSDGTSTKDSYKLNLNYYLMIVAIGLFPYYPLAALSCTEQASNTQLRESATKTAVGYVLGAQDLLTITALDAEELQNKEVRIDSTGFIRTAYIGKLKAAGLTVDELEERLRNLLAKYIRAPQVTVGIVEVRSRPVSVIGAVNAPGVQQIQGSATLAEILSRAGGLRPDAGPVIFITREEVDKDAAGGTVKQSSSQGTHAIEVRVKALIESPEKASNIAILANDVIAVPRAQMVYVVGEVGKSGGFVLNEKEALTAIQALALAQGLTRTAAPQHARILRGQSEQIIRLDRVLSGKEKDILLGPDDTLYVPSSIPKRASIRALEAVIQTGTGIVIWRR